MLYKANVSLYKSKIIQMECRIRPCFYTFETANVSSFLSSVKSIFSFLFE